METKSEKKLVAVLHNIRSVHNVASMFRTADGAGVEKIYITGITPAPIDRFGNSVSQFTKVSLGAEKFVPWEKTRRIGDCIKRLKREGYYVVALEQSPKSIPYHSLKAQTSKLKPTALIVGNEVRGISQALLRTADKIVEIPMRGKKESLNVSVAFGIAVYALIANSQ
jgi:tRNA G18 (ribose-2'-O)-methylase SpoU